MHLSSHSHIMPSAAGALATAPAATRWLAAVRWSCTNPLGARNVAAELGQKPPLHPSPSIASLSSLQVSVAGVAVQVAPATARQVRPLRPSWL